MTICCPGCIGTNASRTTDSHPKRIIKTIYCIHTVVPPDDGPRYARNMLRLTKYTKNKLRIKLVFLYTSVFVILTYDMSTHSSSCFQNSLPDNCGLSSSEPLGVSLLR